MSENSVAVSVKKEVSGMPSDAKAKSLGYDSPYSRKIRALMEEIPILPGVATAPSRFRSRQTDLESSAKAT